MIASAANFGGTKIIEVFAFVSICMEFSCLYNYCSGTYLQGTEFSRGISRIDADEIRARKLKGVEIVHRDDLVIL